MSLELQIVCDGCGVIGDFANPGTRPAHVLRRYLKGIGWTQKGKLDFCAACNPEKELAVAIGHDPGSA